MSEEGRTTGDSADGPSAQQPMSVAQLAERAHQHARLLTGFGVGAAEEPTSDGETVDADEVERLQELEGYRILDSGKDDAFERITKTATRLFNVPFAHVGLMGKDRLWFKSTCGFDAQQTSRTDSICGYAFAPWPTAAETGVLTFGDIQQEPDIAQNRRILRSGLRFYASAPLVSPTGAKLGTLCIADMQPRDPLSEEDKESLQTLAGVVMDLLEARKLAAHFQDVCESKEWQIRLSECGIGPQELDVERSLASSESARLKAWADAREAEIHEARQQELLREQEMHATSSGMP